MITLAMDTSCMTGGVAVIDDGRVVAEHILSVKRTHSERLMSSIARAMEDASLAPSDIGLIACSVGPGSFTGIRIGVASAKAIALARGIPISPVSALDALAYGLPAGEKAVSMIDARHENCYAAFYEGTGGFPSMLSAPSVMTVDQICSRVAQSGLRHHFRGDASLVYGSKIANLLCALAAMPSSEDAGVRPAKVGMCGIAMAGKGLAVSAVSLVPMYLKDSGAEVKAERECPGC